MNDSYAAQIVNELRNLAAQLAQVNRNLQDIANQIRNK